jgi:uncharacterized membrane protein
MTENIFDEGRTPEVLHPNSPEKPAPRETKAPARGRSGEWLVIAGLLLLSFIPIASGAFRLNQLTNGAQVTPANARFFASPLPVIVHIVGASLFAILGAFQFSTALRRRWRAWHRWTGRIVLICGLLVGFSGLWMTLFYQHPVGDGPFLSAQRLLFGTGMIVSLVLAYTTIRRGNMKQHRAWMMRAYAIGLGAGTQALVLMVGEMISGKPDELSRALLMGLAWVINLAVAEWVIRKRLARPNRKAIQPAQAQS